MKVELHGHDEVRVATAPVEVVDALADPEQLLDLLQGMVRPSSTPDRWVMAQVEAGPVRLTPAVDVTVTRRDDQEVTIVGRPVDGHTPAHLDMDLVVVDGDGTSTIRSRWEIAVEVAGPQLLASTIRPLMQASSRRVTRQLAERLHERFGPPPA